MKEVVVPVVVAFLVSFIYNKISAAYTFKEVDSYVMDMCKMTEEFVEWVKSNLRKPE